MRYLTILVALIAAAAFPAAASAHHIDKTHSSVSCTKATVTFTDFTSYDARWGADVKINIDDHQVAFQHVTPDELRSGKPITILYPAPQDTVTHTVTVNANWATGHDSFADTVSNCCPPPPCCQDKPGPPGPSGPAGPAGPAGPPSHDTTTIVERIVEKVVVVERSCTSRRTVRFLVRRKYLGRVVVGVKATEPGFRVKITRPMVRGKHRFRVAVTPVSANAKKAVKGLVRSVKVTVKLSNGRRYITQYHYRQCLSFDNDLNRPSATPPVIPAK